jgi:hypothetical protein
MFCYQPEKTHPYYIAGVYNSKTELLTPERFWELVNSSQVEWLVNKHRAIKNNLDDAKWLDDEDFMEYDRKMRSKPNSRVGKAYINLADDSKRVAMWCDDLKKRLPFVIFIGTYPMRKPKETSEEAMWRSQQHVQLNGLDVLDFDHVEGDVREAWATAFDKLSDEDKARIDLVFVSPGGKGLKVVFEADEKVGNLIDNQIVLSSKLGLAVDEACKDAARGTFLTTKNDIIFINEEKLFNYENQAFSEKYAEQYHRGNSQPTIDLSVYSPLFSDTPNSNAVSGSEPSHVEDERPTDGNVEDITISFNGWSGGCQKLIEELYRESGVPGSDKGDKKKSRHTESLKLASDLLIVTGRNKDLVEKIVKAQPWVQDIINERGEDVHKTVEDADASVREKERKFGPDVKPSIAFMAAVKRLRLAERGRQESVRDAIDSKLEDWGSRIEAMFDTFPCLREACQDLRKAAYPAALYTSAAFFGTDMTRTWWHFWHRPEEVRRFNYCVMVIGDPGTGKSFATRLFKLIAAPLIAADKVGNDAVNRYKKELKRLGTTSDKNKKEGLTPPDVVVRIVGTRTSNGVFIENMNKAVEMVNNEPFHLHLLTFDSELDSATMASKGGQWIDKSVFELKAFHNEEDDQHYKNNDAVDGPFEVFWNFVYTGTPLSLHRKVTERNFGSGLFSRLGVIPFPSSNFKMMELRKQTKVNQAADELLKTWAFRLDGVKGELPLWPLAEHTHAWMSERLEIADFNNDRADELLLKRVPYYGVCVATPFILMRHWDEWEKSKTFEIDDKDRELCSLVMEIQHECQRYYFGKQAEMYFENEERDAENRRVKSSKYVDCYERLPEAFKLETFMETYGLDNKHAAYVIISRLKKNGAIANDGKGAYKKKQQKLL